MSQENCDEAGTAKDLEDIKDFYDSVYYADVRTQPAGRLRHHYLQLHQRLNIRSGAAVLDVACGTGEWLDICKDRGCTIAGVDLSNRAIDVCRERLPDGEFHAQPAESLPFDDGVFDVVTCLGSLEHFVDPVSSLKEMVRVGKSDASIVILVPNKDFLTRRIGLFAGTYQVDAREVVRSLDEWAALFDEAGLSIVDRWKDLHVLNRDWMTTGSPWRWPLRALQAAMLVVWPLKWQYQVYHRCVRAAPLSS